jgi:hypothetical protein
MPLRDLRLEECTQAFQGYGQFPPLKTPALRRAGRAYQRNVKRVYSFALFVPAAVASGITAGILGGQVAAALRGQDERTIDAAISRRVRAHMLARTRKLTRGGTEAKAIVDHELTLAFRQLNKIAYGNADGAEGWLAAQITNTWTAFEAMAADLWEAALNAKPKGLANLSGRKHEKKEDRRISLSWLQSNNYNLSRKMGTVLKEQYHFDSLSEIRRAYSDAFPRTVPKVHSALSDKALDAISLIRNVLVHNGGIIDREYLDGVAHLPPEAIGPLNSPIKLDGPLVGEIVGPVLKIGYDLVTSVDQWLATH